MPNTLGSKTDNIFLKGPDGHNIFMELEVGTAVHIAQPVKFNGNGKIQPAAGTDTGKAVIGYSIMDKKAGELCTIVTKYRTIVYGQATEAIAEGDKLKLAPSVYDEATNRIKYAKLSGADNENLCLGIALTSASESGDEIAIGLF